MTHTAPVSITQCGLCNHGTVTLLYLYDNCFCHHKDVYYLLKNTHAAIGLALFSLYKNYLSPSSPFASWQIQRRHVSSTSCSATGSSLPVQTLDSTNTRLPTSTSRPMDIISTMEEKEARSSKLPGLLCKPEFAQSWSTHSCCGRS